MHNAFTYMLHQSSGVARVMRKGGLNDDATAPIVAKHSSRTNDMETKKIEESGYLAFIHYKHVRKFVLQRFLIFEWNICLIDVLIDVNNLSANTTINGVIQNVMIGILRNPDRTRTRTWTRTRRKPGLGKNPDSCSDSRLSVIELTVPMALNFLQCFLDFIAKID